MICIGFGTNERWTSKLIRWATDSQWSHCWLEYPSAVWGGQWVAHSGANGVVKIPVERVYKKYPKRGLYELKLEPEEIDRGFSWARSRIGVDYDYGVIWNAILLILWRATGWKYLWKIVYRNAAKDSCSEFVSGFLAATGMPGGEKLDPELTPPEGVWELCYDSARCVWLGHG